MSQGSSTTRRLNPIRRRSEFLVGDHLNEPLMNDEESKKMDSSIQFGGVQTKPESLQEQINNKTISDDRREQF
jgi:hypothetical protein